MQKNNTIKVYKGIIKKVLKEEHYKEYEDRNIAISDIKLKNTIMSYEIEGACIEALPIKLFYQELDKNGNGRFTFDTEREVYTTAYTQTPILYAVEKEMRIILEYGELAPIKVVVEELVMDDNIVNQIICVQNQHAGLE